MNQLNELRKLLELEGISYENKSILSADDGLEIKLDECDSISIICHQFSYGYENGLCEMMASFIEDSVKGDLTAKECLSLIKNRNILFNFLELKTKIIKDLKTTYCQLMSEALKQ